VCDKNQRGSKKTKFQITTTLKISGIKFATPYNG
jgi:hypothetical protein